MIAPPPSDLKRVKDLNYPPVSQQKAIQDLVITWAIVVRSKTTVLWGIDKNFQPDAQDSISNHSKLILHMYVTKLQLKFAFDDDAIKVERKNSLQPVYIATT